MPRTTSRGFNRRTFLQASAVAGAAASSALWWPRSALSAPGAAVKRVILIYARGGMRFNASFDAHPDPKANPWGILPWTLVGGGATQPEWGFSRLLLQRPLHGTPDFVKSEVLAGKLASTEASRYNLSSPTLSAAWKGVALPSLARVAADVAVVRAVADPFDGDHQAASNIVATGYSAGQVGLLTMFQHALKTTLQESFESFYDLPAVDINMKGKWGVGTGDYSHSRPMVLVGPAALPKTDPGKHIPPWGSTLEQRLDEAYQVRRQAFMGQSVADFMNDKSAGDANVGKQIDPALHLTDADGSSSLGTLRDGATPVTNDMLAEVFGLRSDLTPPGDILFDIFGAADNVPVAEASWTSSETAHAAALAVRLLQAGSPVVGLGTVGVGGLGYDTHSNEVFDPTTGAATGNAVSIPLLGRILSGLAFALDQIADDQDPTRSLWDSTVVLVCSEFGRYAYGSSGFFDSDLKAGGGSGHHAWSSIVALGGPVAAGGKLITDPDAGVLPYTNDVEVGGFYSQNRVFTSVLEAMGISAEQSEYLSFSEFPPISGLFKATA